jgi:hypothetical protein
MKRIRTSAPRIRRHRRWPEDLPDDPRDPDVVRAKALARARPAHPGPAGRMSSKQRTAAAIAVDNRGGAP